MRRIDLSLPLHDAPAAEAARAAARRAAARRGAAAAAYHDAALSGLCEEGCQEVARAVMRQFVNEREETTDPHTKDFPAPAEQARPDDASPHSSDREGA